MRTSAISTASLLNTPRAGVTRMQTEMARLSKEMATGRMADVGLNFGAATSRNVTLHVDLNAFTALSNSLNGTVLRLDQTDASLDAMTKGANGLLDTLLSSMQSPGAVGALKQAAESALSSFIAGANTSDGQGYIFGGINSAVPPIADYDAGPGAAVDAAFLAKFGLTQDDPGAAQISAADISDFLDNEFASLFADPAWGSTWSSASDQPMSTRLAGSDTIQTSVSANTPAMRKLAMVYTMVAGLGVDRLGSEARQAVLEKAVRVAGEGITDLISVQADVGNSKNRLKDAVQHLTLQHDITQQHLASIEGVDPAEAKVRFDSLSTEVEMSYSLTAKLLKTSLLNYV